MATYYVGSRPVLQGRNSNNAINPNTGQKGKYTYYGFWHSEQVLDGAPNTALPRYGTSDYRSGGILPYLAGGKAHVAPLNNPGLGPRVGNGLAELLQYKGVPSGKVFNGAYGQYNDVEMWVWVFDGVPGAEDPLDDPGRVGVVKEDPHLYKGVSVRPMNNPGHTIAATNGEISRWDGVPSSKAL